MSALTLRTLKIHNCYGLLLEYARSYKHQTAGPLKLVSCMFKEMDIIIQEKLTSRWKTWVDAIKWKVRVHLSWTKAIKINSTYSSRLLFVWVKSIFNRLKLPHENSIKKRKNTGCARIPVWRDALKHAVRVKHSEWFFACSKNTLLMQKTLPPHTPKHSMQKLPLSVFCI